jgi:hypothetical protein
MLYVTSVPSPNDFELVLDGRRILVKDILLEKEIYSDEAGYPVETGRKFVTLKFAAEIENGSDN